MRPRKSAPTSTSAHDQLFTSLCGLVTERLPLARVSAADWNALAELAIQHGLAPMLYWLAKAQQQAIPEPAASQLAEITHNAAINNAVLESARRQVQTAFTEAGIPCLWLKGAALTRTIYPEIGLRSMADLDVLVPYDQREDALQIVHSLHYEDEYRTSEFFSMPTDKLREFAAPKHHYCLYGGDSGLVTLELHYRLLSFDDRLLSLESLGWFWETKQTLTLSDGTQLDCFSNEAQFLHLCAHIVLQHAGDELFLIRYFDLHLLITRQALNWDVILDQAVAFGWTLTVELALTRTAEFFATPIPAAVLRALVERRPAHEDVSRVHLLAGDGSRWESWRLYLATLPPRKRWEMLRRVLFPSRAYMRQRYHAKSGIMLYYPYRWLDQGRIVLMALWKRLRYR